MTRARVDPVAGSAAVLALVMLGVYLAIMRTQGDAPVAWAVAALVIGAAAAAFGAVSLGQQRRPALVCGAVVLLVVGFLAILSIGLPILGAGALCVIAAVRDRSPAGS